MKTLNLAELGAVLEPVVIKATGKAQRAISKGSTSRAARKRAEDFARHEARPAVAETFKRIHASKEFSFKAALDIFGPLGGTER